MFKVSLHNVWKIYPNSKDVAPAVQDFNLDVEDGEFIVLVGSSGCGKTTTLRMIAGLESITKGEIAIDGKVVNNLSPKKRNIAMVFQNYALYPNLNLYDNIAFGLRLRKMEKYKIEEIVSQKSKQLQIDHLLDRLPKDISGGQRQRVALGRAIVRDPSVFLMDEPLSNLDATMRVQMRTEISKLHRDLGATTIYVTHDQTEAMTMGDRIVVMNQGIIQQIGTPEEIFNTPSKRYVAGFIGSPPMNFFKGRIVENNGSYTFQNTYMNIKIPNEIVQGRLLKAVNYDLIGGIRPEYMSVAPLIDNKVDEFSFRAELDITELVGADRYVHARISPQDTAIIRTSADNRFKSGEKLVISADMKRFLFFDSNTGERIF